MDQLYSVQIEIYKRKYSRLAISQGEDRFAESEYRFQRGYAAK